MKNTDILILGGGMAGLGCAHELAKKDVSDFLLLSKDIGGRAPNSKESGPRATFYARKEYRNLAPFLTLGRKADVMKGRLVCPDKIYSPWGIFLRHPVLGLKFCFRTLKFNRHYDRFSKRCEEVSQKAAFKEDPYLLKLYSQPALEYLKENGLMVLAEELVGTLVRVTQSVPIEKVNAFTMFWTWLILMSEARECSLDIEKITEPFKDKIVLAEITSIEKVDNGWIVKTYDQGDFLTKKLVVGFPITVTKKLINDGIPDYLSSDMYSVVVKGKAKPHYDTGRYNVLPSTEKDIVVVNNDDGTYLFFSTQKDFDLDKYFDYHQVISRKDWTPAAFFNNALLEAKRSDDLYLIGDYHFPGLEAAFVTGIQAAHSIVSR